MDDQLIDGSDEMEDVDVLLVTIVLVVDSDLVSHKVGRVETQHQWREPLSRPWSIN